jgi:acetyl-CoA carboxylase biotin carboxyl carrier protein
MDIDIEQLRELMRSLAEFDVSEVEIENGDERISLRRGPAMADNGATLGMASTSTIAPAPAATAAALALAARESEEADVQWVTSPFVGTFYRSPGPDADPFVAVGSKIEHGTVLCIVEAMKLMNEIESDVSGTILEILAENGKPVEYGDRLFKVSK